MNRKVAAILCIFILVSLSGCKKDESDNNYLYSYSSFLNSDAKTTDLENTYDTYKAAVKDTGHKFFLRHELLEDENVETSLGYVKGNKVYYLLSGFNEEQRDQQFEKNQEILLKIFGEKNCTIKKVYINCVDGKVGASANKSGTVRAFDANFGCAIESTKSASCGEREDF